MKVGVLGPAGFSGSHCVRELLERGHEVFGISRNPERLGQHASYKPVSLDLASEPIDKIVSVFTDVDVVVNAYDPPPGPGMYKEFVETTRRILIAAKAAKQTNPDFYFISIGGTGSLHLPDSKYQTTADSREFWLAYRRSVADSEAATAHMEERMGPGAVADGMRAYRNARMKLQAKRTTLDDDKVIKEVEESIKSGPNPVPDLPFAARAAFMMFDGNSTFEWSFVSPPGRFRPGPRTGKYEVWVDKLPVSDQAVHESPDGNAFEGRLLGVSAADLAVAIVDEAENKQYKGKHWSPTSEWEEDKVWPTYLRL